MQRLWRTINQAEGDPLARTPLRQTDPSQIGRYRLVARLGAGGMGVVYLGVDPNGEQVAVKVLRPELADNPEFRVRFGREVTMLTRVQGVCTVRVIAADTEAPKPFLVTEYADGPSLSEYIDTRGPLDAGMLYGLATGLAEALAAIHAAGIVHRDLKPSNVILTARGPKVIDFGIAQALDTTSLTKTGITVGSAGFMAPEQIIGKAGTAADIFTWAVTIAYAASGQSPFGTGASDIIMYRIVHGVPDITAVPPGLRPLVEAALAKEPRDRPSAPQLLSQLTQSTAARSLAESSVGYGNPTQTILAQTWHPSAPVTAVPPPGTAVPPPGTAVPPPGTVPPVGHRSSRRRTALLPVVLTLAFLLAAGGTAVGLALARGSGGTHGPAGASTTQTLPAQLTPASTHGTTTPPTSPASTPATTTPATTTPATTSPATTSPATTSPATTTPATTTPATTTPATTTPTSTGG
jgi:serine/threonine protein kinase